MATDFVCLWVKNINISDLRVKHQIIAKIYTANIINHPLFRKSRTTLTTPNVLPILNALTSPFI